MVHAELVPVQFTVCVAEKHWLAKSKVVLLDEVFSVYNPTCMTSKHAAPLKTGSFHAFLAWNGGDKLCVCVVRRHRLFSDEMAWHGKSEEYEEELLRRPISGGVETAGHVLGTTPAHSHRMLAAGSSHFSGGRATLLSGAVQAPRAPLPTCLPATWLCQFCTFRNVSNEDEDDTCVGCGFPRDTEQRVSKLHTCDSNAPQTRPQRSPDREDVVELLPATLKDGSAPKNLPDPAVMWKTMTGKSTLL